MSSNKEQTGDCIPVFVGQDNPWYTCNKCGARARCRPDNIHDLCTSPAHSKRDGAGFCFGRFEKEE
jgi:hypothetical protein